MLCSRRGWGAASRVLFPGLASVFVIFGASGCGDAFQLTDGSGSGAGSTSASSSDASSGAGGQSATSSGAGGETSSTSGSGGSGGSGAEDCANGVDDNEDGLVDCSDPLCGAYTCAAPVPEGWSGPVAFFFGDSGNAPSCGGAWSTERAGGGGELSVDPTVCDCTCGAPSGISCGLPTLASFTDSQCSIAGTVVSISAANQCIVAQTGQTLAGSALPGVPPAVGGNCMGALTPTYPPPVWENTGVVCEAASLGGGCPEERVCAPKPTEDFRQKLCVYAEIDAKNCPDGPYSQMEKIYQHFDDQRTCTGCGCAPPTGASCSGTTTFYKTLQCNAGSDVGLLVHDGTCDDVALGTLAIIYKPDAPIGGSCSALPATADGVVSPAGPLTVCCEP